MQASYLNTTLNITFRANLLISLSYQENIAGLGFV